MLFATLRKMMPSIQKAPTEGCGANLRGTGLTGAEQAAIAKSYILRAAIWKTVSIRDAGREVRKSLQ